MFNRDGMATILYYFPFHIFKTSQFMEIIYIFQQYNL